MTANSEEKRKGMAKKKPTIAWGLKDQYGYLFSEAHFYKKDALARSFFIYEHTCQKKPSVVRVLITEIKDSPDLRKE